MNLSSLHSRSFPLTAFVLLLVFSFLLPTLCAAQGVDFLVLGDWGRDGDDHQSDVARIMGTVADTMVVDFVVSTGDNFYTSGVKSVNDRRWMTSFEMIYTAPSLNVPWYAALGNHDYRGNWKAQIEYSATSQRWRMPAPYYTFRYEINDSTSAQFFVLDTNPFPRGYRYCLSMRRLWFKSTDEQLAWFEEELAATDAEWKIVIGHHGLYSTGSRHGDTKSLRKTIEPLLNKFGVQAWFNGHDHNLQHQDPVGSDVQYFTSGAGSRLQKIDRDIPDQTRFAVSTHGFMTVRVEEDSLRVQVVDYQGTLLYETVVGRDGIVRQYTEKE